MSTYNDCRTREELIKFTAMNKTLKARVVSSRKGSDGIARYTAEITTGQHRWNVEYRYSEWLDLEKEVISLHDNTEESKTKFPPKKILGSQSKSTQAERKAAFNHYISELVSDPATAVSKVVMTFLTGGHPTMDAYKDRILELDDDIKR